MKTSTSSDTSSTPSRKNVLTSIFINQNFALLFGGQAISLLGDQIFTVTLLVWVAADIVAGQPWAPLAVSGLAVAGIIPVFLFGPLAGVFVDRWDKRRTMLCMDLLRAVLIASLLWLPFQGSSTPLFKLLFIYLIMFLESTCAEFFSPARFALLGDVVTAEKRPQATGLGQVSQALAVILGPPIAAPLLFSVGPQWAIFVDVCSFVISFGAILAARLPPVPQTAPLPEEKTAKKSIGREFLQGLQFVFRNRIIRALVVSSFLLMLGVGSFSTLGVFFVAQNLHVDINYTGVLLSFLGAGGVIGAIVFGMLATRIGIKRLFVSSIILAALLYILFSRLESFLAASIVLLLLGMMQAALNVTTAPILLQETPKDLVGRTVSILSPMTTLGLLLSVTGAGYLSGVTLAKVHTHLLGMSFGPIDTVFTFSGLIILLGGIFSALSMLNRPGRTQQALNHE